MRIVALLIFISTTANAEKFISLENIYKANPWKDADIAFDLGKPYIIKPHSMSPQLPPIENREKWKCWEDNIEIKILNGFTDSMTGYETVRDNVLLFSYAKHFNMRMMRKLLREGRVECSL